MWFLGQEQVWTNRPVEHSLAQSQSAAAPGVTGDTWRSTGHNNNNNSNNTAPAAAWGNPILTPLTHRNPPNLPSLLLPLRSVGVGHFDLFMNSLTFYHQLAPPVTDKGRLQVSDHLNRTSDECSDGQESRGRVLSGWWLAALKDFWMSLLRSVIWKKEGERNRKVMAPWQAIDHPDDPLTRPLSRRMSLPAAPSII